MNQRKEPKIAKVAERKARMGGRSELPEHLLAELDRRKAASALDPSLLTPWEVVRERLGLQTDAGAGQQA
jgi:hypothetical protein